MQDETPPVEPDEPEAPAEGEPETGQDAHVTPEPPAATAGTQ